MARATDGYVYGGGPPRALARAVERARDAWDDAGRPGRPEVRAMTYFALGGEQEAGRGYMLDYYAFTGPYAGRIADELLTSPLAVRELVQGYADAGCEHLMMFPTVADPAQLEALADALGL